MSINLGTEFFLLKQRTSLQDVLELFLLDCRAQGLTDDTLRFYRGRLSLFVAFSEESGAGNLEDFTHTSIKAWLADLQARELSSSYIHSHARALKTFGNFCVREGLADVSPFARVKMPRLEKKILEALTQDEVKRLLAACLNERDKTILLFMLDSGVRASELVALNVGDVDAVGAVSVRAGKGQKGRLTYIGARTRKALRRYFVFERDGEPEPTEPLFTSRNTGKRLTYFGVRQICRRLQERTGIEHCAAHTFRRTMAINSLRNGMNIYVLAKMMGHADIHVLKQYLDIVQDDVKDAARAAGVVDNLL